MLKYQIARYIILIIFIHISFNTYSQSFQTVIQAGHSSVYDFDINSKKGLLLTSSCEQLNIKLWSFKNRILLNTYSGFTDYCVHACAISHDRFYVAGVSRGELKVWDYVSDTLVVDIEVPRDVYDDLFFDGASNFIVGKGADTFFIFDLGLRQLLELAHLGNDDVYGPVIRENYLSFLSLKPGEKKVQYKIIDLFTQELVFSETINLINYPSYIWMGEGDDLVNIVLEGDGKNLIRFWPKKNKVLRSDPNFPSRKVDCFFCENPETQLIQIDDQLFFATDNGAGKIMYAQSLVILDEIYDPDFFFDNFILDTFSHSLLFEKIRIQKNGDRIFEETKIYDFIKKKYHDPLSTELGMGMFSDGKKTLHPLNEEYWLFVEEENLDIVQKATRKREKLSLKPMLEPEWVTFLSDQELCLCYPNRPPVLMDVNTFETRQFKYDKTKALHPEINAKHVNIFEAGYKACEKILFLSDEIYVFQDSRVFVFDRENLEVKREEECREMGIDNIMAVENKLYATGGFSQRFFVYDFVQKQVIKEIKTKGDIKKYALSPDMKTVALIHSEKVLEVYDLENHKLLLSANIKEKGFRNHWINLVSYPLDPDNFIATFSMINDNSDEDKSIFYLLKPEPQKANKYGMEAMYELSDRFIAEYGHSNNKEQEIIYFPDTPIVVMDKKDGIKTTFFDGDFDFFKKVRFNPSGNIAAYVTNTDEVKLINLKTFKPIYSIGSFSDGFFFFHGINSFYTYRGVPNNEIRFKSGMNSFSLHQFDLSLNRPDTLMALLPNCDEKIYGQFQKLYQKRLKRFGNLGKEFIAVSNAPIIEKISFDQNVDTSVNVSINKKITIEIISNTKTSDLSRLNCWLNDVPVYGVGGLDINPSVYFGYKIIMELYLSEGTNNIEISIVNAAGVESEAHYFNISYMPETIEKPNLYFIGIGVANYEKLPTLSDVDKDISDLSSIIQRNQNKYYRDVKTFSILNEKFQKDTLVYLKDFLSHTTEGDVVLVFYSGHGGFDDKGNYFIFTSKTSKENIADEGVAFTDLLDILDGIPSRNKLLLVNACYSGEYDDDMSLFRKMNDTYVNLNRGNGTMVISSSASDQVSYTGLSKFEGNSAFGRAIIDGFDNHKHITVAELSAYLRESVFKLSRRPQLPELRNIYKVKDFRIW